MGSFLEESESESGTLAGIPMPSSGPPLGSPFDP
jgi:hypothetical protein